MAVKFHQIHRGDIQIGMFYIHRSINFFPKLHTQSCDFLNVIHFQLQPQILGINQGKKGSFKGNITGHSAPFFRPYLNILFI